MDALLRDPAFRADRYMARLFERFIVDGGDPGREFEFRALQGDDYRGLRGDNDRPYWPALAVPLGPGDRLGCPPFHVDSVLARLATHNPPHLLIVGYSALDR